MKVLDLFAGLGGWSKAFKDAGHDVITLDYLPAFECDITTDIRTWDRELPWQPDIILASPPCEKFSTLSFQNGYFKVIEGTITPIRPEAFDAIDLVQTALDIILELAPRWWVMENPRAILRKLDILPMNPQCVWYCHVGHPFAKPTDLWGCWPESLVLPEPCHNQRATHPMDCCCHDHVSAPRGSMTGTQGPGAYRRGSLQETKRLYRQFYGTSNATLLAAARAEIPIGLSSLFLQACERNLA